MMRRGRDEAADVGGDDRLLGRLRQLSLVDVDSLLFGASGAREAELVTAYADDLADALGRARERMAELVTSIAGGPDPLQLATAPATVRSREGAGSAASRVVARLGDRAEACRELARLDEACAHLVPRLVELDRRRAG